MLKVLLYFSSHILLAYFMRKFPSIATAHALIVLVLGVYWSILRRNVTRVAYVAAYMTGAEVLWRMTKAHVFWEYGKYAVGIIFLLSIVGSKLRRPFAPILYFLILLPGVFVTLVGGQDFSQIRDQISFNLSGPFLVTLSILFFSRFRFTKDQLQQIFLTLLGPVIGVAFLAIFKTVTTEDIIFTHASNLATSGGFGPNQVSAILGFGALLSFFSYLDGPRKKSLKNILLVIAIALLTQSVLTFSRGGVVSFTLGALCLCFFLIDNNATRYRVIGAVGILFILAHFLIIPRLYKFTGGMVEVRFKQQSMTHREDIMKDDIALWKTNPIFGVGVGQAPFYRTGVLKGKYVAAHTEFSRLVAEHGTLGLIDIFLLGLMSLSFFKRAKSNRHKALVISMLVWSFSFMTANAMRLVAPSFAIGLASSVLLPNIIPRRVVRNPSIVDPSKIQNLPTGS